LVDAGALDDAVVDAAGVGVAGAGACELDDELLPPQAATGGRQDDPGAPPKANVSHQCSFARFDTKRRDRSSWRQSGEPPALLRPVPLGFEIPVHGHARYRSCA
jgi:hypothetical protein